jgi:hypothetical protein
MEMTDEQRKSHYKHIDRARARRGDGDKELSLFIRVAESRIYHGKALHKALLKEVIFLRLHDLHESDTRIPKGTPWSADYRKNEGWCYASQKYLANRVGSKDPSYVGEVLREIEADGFLRSRSYAIPNRGSQRRKQYFPLEANINAKIIELGLEADEGSDDNSDGVLENHTGTQGLNPSAEMVKPSRTAGLNPPARSGLSSSPQGLNPKKEALEHAYQEGVTGRSLSSPPLGVADNQELRSLEPKEKPKSKSKAMGVGGLVVDGISPETHRLLRFLDDDEPEIAAVRNPIRPSAAPGEHLEIVGECFEREDV